MKAIISGGGTGGHIFPAIAIANALMEKDSSNEILFVGAKGKMEMEKVPEAGYSIIGLPIRGIQRSLSIANLKVPFLLIQSLIISRKTIKKFKPDIAIGVGGYASAALVYTATFMGVKTIIQEQNSFPGITNKILSKRVNRIYVAFANMDRFFPKEKIRLLGNPIRKDILSGQPKSQESLNHFKLDRNRKTLLALGGSLGARTINRCMIKLMPVLDELNLQLIWQCGKNSADRLTHEVEDSGYDHVHLYPFIKRMDLAYAASDIIISRAGALSVSEIMTLKKPAILIPSPNVAEDHQTKNAKALTEQGAAILLEDKLAEENILPLITELVSNDQRLEEIKMRLEGVYSNTNAAMDIANEIEDLIGDGTN